MAAAHPVAFSISPEYLRTAGTALLAGRDFTWHDNENAPRVAVINREFARRVFGSVPNATGRYFKLPEGKRIQVVGIVEDGKYSPNLTDPLPPAMFLPLLQSPSTETYVVVRSSTQPPQLASAIRTKLRELDSGLPPFLQTWNQALDGALFVSRTAALSLGVLGVMGAMLAVTGIFGMAALGRAVKVLAVGSATGLLLGILASRVLASIVYQASSRDPLVLAVVVLAMGLLGLLAIWIPAQRAISVDPAILLREE
jgi:hypothetical protein